ncbi:uncharacterized protein [Rutidosis leptorrhynchoides]|uniref:uncharacterized protein n=1 Tax=Rutidosis leptorrhynchoides TaxID=125765 RepID=UPI003A99B8E7
MIAFPSMFNTNPSDAPVVIEARIENCVVGGIYTDTGAGEDIMYEHCFIQLPNRDKAKLKDTFVPLASFANDPSWLEGSVVLEVVLGKTPFKRTAHIEFLVVKANSQYNVILGRSAMMAFGAVTSTNSCYKILATNLDVFAWQDSDMTGVPRHVAEHKLGVNPNIPPVCQKKRGMAPDRTKFLKEEVKKLVDAGILREVKYQTWVANPVMVRKPDNSWRMCVDFTDLNKACPKDNYPLPEIGWKVESVSGY